jgi:hypothetical protein
MAYNPQIEKVVGMVKHISDKHVDTINWLQLRWEIVDLYDARYNDGLIQQLVPMLDIDFK